MKLVYYKLSKNLHKLQIVTEFKQIKYLHLKDEVPRQMSLCYTEK